jgi:type VI secretion system VgrG family protein
MDSFQQQLEFTVDGLPSDTFTVFRITGREAISELFSFQIEVVSGDVDLTSRKVAGQGACLTLQRLGKSRSIHGMVERIELNGMTPHGDYVYRAVLVPRLHKLAMTRQNQIHGTIVAVSVREVLNDELTASSLKGSAVTKVSGRLGLNDFEIRLTRKYPERDYIVQYDESDLAFISRLCEHYGIFYFFVHDNNRDAVVFGDSRITFPAIEGSGSIAYRPPSGLADAAETAVFRFSGCTRMMPAQVCLRDYNYRIPNLTLEIDEVVDPDGHGIVVEYGSHFRTPEEGRALARVRAEELVGRKQVFEGASDNVLMTAGAVFDLTDHFHDRFNAGYLITWIEHEATQAIPGIAEFAGPDRQTSYRNRFECLPKSVEFRPARVTPKPKMAGLTNAVVDAAGSGLRAELDETGRYKIRQQFDQRGEAAGQASRYMRKAEPYGGANSGIHFPLLKNTEVILACVNGDPDRPIIVGAMQNSQSTSIVTSGSSTKNRIQTTSGGLFEIDDGPASASGGGSGGSGATLAPQRALEGTDTTAATDAPVARSLAAQRAESDIQTSGGATSSYVRLQVTAGTDSYWRLGSEPTDTTEDTRTPGMSDMSRRTAVGGAGLFEYTVGDRSSLIKGSSYAQVVVDRLDYVAGKRRMSASTHNAVSKGEYQIVAQGLSIDIKKSGITDNSSSSTSAPPGEIYIGSESHTNFNTLGDFSHSTAGSVWAHNAQTAVSQTWGSTANFMMGAAISMTLGTEITINFDVAISIAAFLKVDVFLGVSFDIRVGPKFEFETSPAVELNAALMKSTMAYIKTNATSAVTNVLALVSAMATVKTRNVQAEIAMVDFKVITNQTTI